MEKIIVLGIGNRLMMDDGIGIYLLEELEKQQHSTNIYYLIGESDIDYCIDQIERATFVIILDAAFSGKKTGEITIFPLADLHENQKMEISHHNLHLFQMLVLQKETIKGYLIGVEPYEVKFHIGLSQPIKEQWERITQDVSEALRELIKLET